MTGYIVSYDVDDGASDDYTALKKAICACVSQRGQKVLESFWCVVANFTSAAHLKQAIVRRIKDRDRIEGTDLAKRLHLVVARLDLTDETRRPISRYAPINLDHC